MPNDGNKNWNEWSNFVLEALKETKHELRGVKESIAKLRQDVIILKVKASIMGIIAGGITALIINYLKEKV